jgi:hypothetical protein
MTSEVIRPATAADLTAVKDVTDAAYEPCIERIGVVPVPMDADHAADVGRGEGVRDGRPSRRCGGGRGTRRPPVPRQHRRPPARHGGGTTAAALRRRTRTRALGLPEVRLYTHAMMWENQQIYLKFGYEVVGRRVDGPYDRVHKRKRLE